MTAAIVADVPWLRTLLGEAESEANLEQPDHLLPPCVYYLGVKFDLSGHAWCGRPAAFYDELKNSHCNRHRRSGDRCFYTGPRA